MCVCVFVLAGITPTKPVAVALSHDLDPTRRGYLDGVCRAVADDSVNLSAYFAWSLIDNFEWNEVRAARDWRIRNDSIWSTMAGVYVFDEASPGHAPAACPHTPACVVLQPQGYRPRFGIVHVDRKSRTMRRYPKLSAYWLSHHFFKHAPDEIACLGALPLALRLLPCRLFCLAAAAGAGAKGTF